MTDLMTVVKFFSIFTLFETATKSIEILQKAQQDAERMYIEQESASVVRLAKKDAE